MGSEDSDKEKPHSKMSVPSDLLFKCPRCQQVTFMDTFRENKMVCPNCRYHGRITVSERLLTSLDLQIGKTLSVEGQFRSYNSYQNERNKLILTVFAKDIIEVENQESENEENQEEKKDTVTNEVILSGYVCKKPIYRQTPFDREIADLLLAVNRAYNKSDYIPCIAWGRNARFCQNMEVGTEVRIVGRVQSRKYEKKFEDGTSETRVAYEVSISSMEIVEKKDENNVDVG